MSDTEHHYQFDKVGADIADQSRGDPDDMLTNGEVATILRRQPNTLEIWRSKGLGPPFKRIGRNILYRRGDVLDWLRDRTFTSTKDYAA